VLDAVLYSEQQAQAMVAAIRGKAGRVVALSSADVYRNYDGFRRNSKARPDAVPLAEDAPLRDTRYPYRGSGLPFDLADDYEKILVGQVLLTEPDLPATVLRLPAVYGPGDAQHRLRPYLRRMVDGRPGILLQEEQSTWRSTRGYVGNRPRGRRCACRSPCFQRRRRPGPLRAAVGGANRCRRRLEGRSRRRIRE
jgi:nucleoside-diphosphate-sugar epimerase